MAIKLHLNSDILAADFAFLRRVSASSSVRERPSLPSHTFCVSTINSSEYFRFVAGSLPLLLCEQELERSRNMGD